MLPSERGALPVVACTIAGRTVPALSDTGNSSLAMSLELAERLGIEPSGGAFSIRGVGQYVTGVALGPALRSARSPFRRRSSRYCTNFTTTATSWSSAPTCSRTLRVAIDYAKGEVFLAPASDERSRRRDCTRRARCRSNSQNFVPVAQVRLGATPAALALDTGDESTVNLAGDFYARNPALFTPTGSLPVAGIGGTSTEVVGTIPSVTLAGFQVTRQRIGATKGLAATADGHLGSGFPRPLRRDVRLRERRGSSSFARGGDAAVSSIPSASQ